MNGLLPYPNDCSRFVFCLNENPTINSCPDQTIYVNEGCAAGKFNPESCFQDRVVQCTSGYRVTLPSVPYEE